MPRIARTFWRRLRRQAVPTPDDWFATLAITPRRPRTRGTMEAGPTRTSRFCLLVARSSAGRPDRGNQRRDGIVLPALAFAQMGSARQSSWASVGERQPRRPLGAHSNGAGAAMAEAVARASAAWIAAAAAIVRGAPGGAPGCERRRGPRRGRMASSVVRAAILRRGARAFGGLHRVHGRRDRH
jgi:hypothetical protein